MVVVMNVDAKDIDMQEVSKKLSKASLPFHTTKSGNRMLFTIAAEPQIINSLCLETCKGVAQVVDAWTPLSLVGKTINKKRTIVNVNGVRIGAGNLTIMAGPCAVENSDQILNTAYKVKQAGAHILRGGAFKPRTSPYSFQGLGEDGLRLLRRAKEKTGLPIVTEVVAINHIDLVCEYADMLQIGSRNMHNYALLQAVGEQTDIPILLKRGMSSTIDEWLSAAEYIVSRGNNNVVLCERGIRTFSKSTRNTLDLSAVPIVKARTHLPIIVDPSHATGHWRLVEPMALAAIAAGADGIMVEVHPKPEMALSDGDQSLTLDNFESLVKKAEYLHNAYSRIM
ncbi:3-deoxy-7-phosphoheptulonate synthase [Clostridium sp. 'deep sea']|uniref:3-deoxy-7-phosphoheptulonate synthase n=1 Tax=Clostridium sp. 'deep sea' TaxID=2779445 RepID=UPI00189694A3|nr:3-deoxy-7-phosphoheptulonate synthase [Clostridium sp. 'deep sea']QOR35644.1 3-deoxy-7-phosphoheptulonate synthase [Clostridium sp. 'deep sea']